MRTDFVEEVKSAVKNWWLSLILGILFVGVAILMMFMPQSSYLALALLFSVCVFVAGIFEIIFSITNKDTLSGWGWYLAGGIIDLLVGILLLVIPGLPEMMIPYLLAFWFMFRGFSAIGFAVDMQRLGSRDWGWYLVFGILAVICAVAIIFRPIAGAITTVYLVAFSFLFIGIFRIMLSFELRNLKKNNEKLRARIKEFHDMMK